MALDYEQLLIFNELSEIIRGHNQCLERMKSFREKYPYLVPPNVAKMVEENLKENVQVLYRELNHIHKPRKEKQRYVCRECHNVFYVRLPNGLCDECRAKVPSSEQPRYGRVGRHVNTGPEEEAEEKAPVSQALPPIPNESSAADAAPPETREIEQITEPLPLEATRRMTSEPESETGNARADELPEIEPKDDD